MKIVVLAGGTSTEREISIVSGSKVCEALRSKGHQAVLVDVFCGRKDTDVDTIFTDPFDLEKEVAYILDEYPDIVLLDINMPGMNGLDLIERIRSIDETISFIIISGYERFDFAQRALQYGVHQYLLKPCNREQILNAVTSVKKRREKLGTLQVLRQENMLLQNRVQATMQEQFLNDIFLPDSDIEKEIDD